MTKITDKLHEMVDQAILRENKSSRNYLGTSSLGESCDRALWYSYHTPKQTDDPQTLRKFNVGHALEPVVLKWLQDAGLQVWTSDSNGNQFGFEDGIIQGHIDAVIRGIPGDEDTAYLGEVKTANQFNFKAFVKEGIGHNEKYLVQVHVYMHKMKLKKCLFIVVNKDSQELYFEVINYDEFVAATALQRGFTIAESSEVPDRKYATKSYFRCKMCTYYKECWE